MVLLLTMYVQNITWPAFISIYEIEIAELC